MILSSKFLESYRSVQPKWGFPSGPNSLGEVVYRRTYSRDGERWVDTVARVVEGVFDHYQRWQNDHRLPFMPDMIQFAEHMFDGMFNFRWLPPGRGLWLMGTEFVCERGGMGLNNCGFVTTQHDLVSAFSWMMDALMLGVGVGFDTRGAGFHTWNPRHDRAIVTIPDSREGWVESLKALLRWGMGDGPEPLFEYHLIRPEGEPIKGFGGVASGPEPLRILHERLRELILRRERWLVTARDIADIGNWIGCCVVAGNVRRSAEILIGEGTEEFIGLKDYAANPDRAAYGWASNNTVLARVGQDYSHLVDSIVTNGEPGLGWLETVRAYGRLKDAPNYRDRRVLGWNPCGEQSLEDKELCCLVETFPHHHETLGSYLQTIREAFFYAKIVSLIPCQYTETNAIIARNRRIGTSMSGVTQFLEQCGYSILQDWCDTAYAETGTSDVFLSEHLGVRESIKRTSIKPSGTVSLLAGASPGCHWPTYRYYIRRIRFAANHPDVQALKEAGYYVEQDVADSFAVIVEFPVRGPETPTEAEVSIEKKMELATFLQYHWADNQVSCTVTFKPEEAVLIESLLIANEQFLKAISFLMITPEGAYKQMPYEAITEAQYIARTANLKQIAWGVSTHDTDDKYCDGDSCANPN